MDLFYREQEKGIHIIIFYLKTEFLFFRHPIPFFPNKLQVESTKKSLTFAPRKSMSIKTGIKIMAKKLCIRLNGRDFSVIPTKLERRKLYGWNELRVVTPDGKLCQQAGLNSDGITIIPTGNTKNGIIREDGLWMERSELVAFDSEGKEAHKVPSSFDTGIELVDRTSTEDLLNHNITSVYQLTGDEGVILASKIGDNIYRFPFSYRGGYEWSTAFILSNGLTTFILVGSDGNYDFIGLEQQGKIDTLEELNFEDDLDFSMF